jgi:hypothetical protein
LFDVSPVSRALFKDDVKLQGNTTIWTNFLLSNVKIGAKLSKLISLAINEYGNRQIFEGALIKLAEFHNKKGVQAVECKSKYSNAPFRFLY